MRIGSAARPTPFPKPGATMLPSLGTLNLKLVTCPPAGHSLRFANSDGPTFRDRRDVALRMFRESFDGLSNER